MRKLIPLVAAIALLLASAASAQAASQVNYGLGLQCSATADTPYFAGDGNLYAGTGENQCSVKQSIKQQTCMQLRNADFTWSIIAGTCVSYGYVTIAPPGGIGTGTSIRGSTGWVIRTRSEGWANIGGMIYTGTAYSVGYTIDVGGQVARSTPSPFAGKRVFRTAARPIGRRPR